jgi:hypothetical protein
MNDYEHFETLTLYGEIPVDEESFTKDITLSFQPDVIILKYISYYNASTDSFPLLVVSTNVTQPSELMVIPHSQAMLEQLNIPFRNHRSISGSYTFTIKGIDGSTNHDAVYHLGVGIVFAKYKNP